MSDPNRTPADLLTECVVKYGEERMVFVLNRELIGRATADERAKADFHTNDDTNIDDDAYVSHADDGFWVSAWVWVSHPACPECYAATDSEGRCPTEDCIAFGNEIAQEE